MKIVMIAPTPFFADRGCHTRIYGEIKGLQQLGHQVVLVTYGLGRDMPGVRTVRCFNFPWYRKLTAGPSVWKILLLPFILTLIPVIMGKFSLLMVLAYLFTATGPIYFMLFQMAVYNKQTLPLNEKITGKNQMDNKWQIIVSMVGMFAPVIMVSLLQLIFSDTVAYWILLIIGLAFTLTEAYWLRNIYRRMMTRRYQNLEGFHATR